MKASVFKLPVKQEKAPASHIFCPRCGIVRVVAEPEFDPAIAVLYDSIKLKCSKCLNIICELYRKKDLYEP